MKNLIYTLLAINLTTPIAFAQDDTPNFSDIRVEDISYRGNGCPPGSTVFDISEDREALTMIFSEFVAETTGDQPHVGVEKDRKNCHIRFALTAPNGWAFSLFSLQHRGYASLDEYTTGVQNTSYQFAGTNGKVNLGRLQIVGPYQDDFIRTDDIPLRSLPWSKCNSLNRLVVDSSILLRSRRSSQGLMTVDSIDGEVRHEYGVLWRKCGSPAANRKFLTVCKIDVERPRAGFDSIITQGYGRNENQSIKRANNKITNRCNRLASRGGHCKLPTLSCNSINLQ